MKSHWVRKLFWAEASHSAGSVGLQVPVTVAKFSDLVTLH